MQPLLIVSGSNLFMSRKRNFWTGLGVGAGIGACAVLLPQLFGRAGASRIIRLEKSIQIGRPVDEVFGGWVESRPRDAQGSVRRGIDRPGPGMQISEMSRSGTFGDEPIQTEPRLAGTGNPMDYTLPPDAKR